MADLGATLKGMWLKSMEAIGNAASNIASNTKSKVDEMNLVNRRAEILNDFGSKAYALWQKGESFPEELDQQLQELQKLDERLNDLRAERLAGVKPPEEIPEDKQETAGEDAAEPAADNRNEADTSEENDDADSVPEDDQNEAAAVQDHETADDSEEDELQEEVPVIRVERPEETEQNVPDVKESIQSLFDKVPTAQEAADKVNDAIDSLGEGLKQFGDQMDQTINELTDRIKGE